MIEGSNYQLPFHCKKFTHGSIVLSIIITDAHGLKPAWTLRLFFGKNLPNCQKKKKKLNQFLLKPRCFKLDEGQCWSDFRTNLFIIGPSSVHPAYRFGFSMRKSAAAGWNLRTCSTANTTTCSAVKEYIRSENISNTLLELK